MKKFAVILVILSLTRIGVAYADSTNTTNSQNYFFGTKSAQANLNQVLALLVGPKGEPGPAGVAGKDGLIGMDGKDGRDGLDGAPGAVGATGAAGPAGTSVLAVAFTGAQGTCSTGGVKFTDGAGTVTYTCNGTNGLNGLNGTNGINGTNGVNGGNGGGGSLTYGQGVVQVGACDTDGVVALDVTRKYNGIDFVFNQFTFGDSAVTDGDVDPACSGLPLAVYITIGNSVTKDYRRMYQPGDVITCSKVISNNPWPTSNPQFIFNDSLTPNICKITSRTSSVTSYFAGRSETPATVLNSTLAIEDISTADYTDRIGFSIG